MQNKIIESLNLEFTHPEPFRKDRWSNLLVFGNFGKHLLITNLVEKNLVVNLLLLLSLAPFLKITTKKKSTFNKNKTRRKVI